MSQKYFRIARTFILESNGWKKLANPSVSRGQTGFPKASADQQSLGIRFDYDGEVTIDEVVYHKFQVQPNAGNDIPNSVKKWRDAHGGTHAVMTNLYVKKNSTKEEVEESLKTAFSKVETQIFIF